MPVSIEQTTLVAPCFSELVCKTFVFLWLFSLKKIIAIMARVKFMTARVEEVIGKSYRSMTVPPKIGPITSPSE